MAGIAPVRNLAASDVSQDSAQNYTTPLITVTTLFFMWGFITCLNDILIPKLKEVFDLQQWQAMLIQSAFFGAYFFVSLGYFIISITKGDPIRKMGYKNGIITGLLVAATGCLLFLPAANLTNYAFFLGALFVLASGVTILQIAANPYVAILGPASGASSRMNLTQALNSLGTTIAPILGGYLIFETFHQTDSTNAESVKMPYLALAGLLIFISIIIKLTKLPSIAEENTDLEAKGGALQYRHLVLGIICIFAYVGGEVSIGSNLINYLELPHIAGLSEAEAKYYLAFFWGGAMIGRFFGAIALSQLGNKWVKLLIITTISALTFLTVFSFYDITIAFITLKLIALNLSVFLLGRSLPGPTLGFFAGAVMILLGFTIFAEGSFALWSVVAIGLFNSIMFPTIFTLAISGLGMHTSQASSLLVMAIVGGAIVPPLQGYIADISNNLQLSFMIPLICYLYIFYYGFWGSKPKVHLSTIV